MLKNRIINISLMGSITLTLILVVSILDVIEDRQVLINHPSFALLWVATLAILVEVGPLQLWRIYLYHQLNKMPPSKPLPRREFGDPQTKGQPEEDLYDG